MKTQTHIAIVSNTSWYLFNFRAKLIEELIGKGYRVTAIAPLDNYSLRLKNIGCDHIDIHINNNGVNPFTDLKTLLNFYHIYSKMKFDLILQYTPKPNIYGTMAARMVNIPCINNIAGLGSAFINGGIVRSIVRILYKLSQVHARCIFFQNPDDLELFVRSGLVQPQKTDLLPGSGVNIDKFYPEKKRGTDTFRFVFIARLLWEKGIREYVDAARILKKQYSHIHFHVLGLSDDSNPRSVSDLQMQDWKREGLIKWFGHVDDVRPHIAEADCVVLPSYREGTPRSLLEAASMGKPIITTDVVGCRQVVEDGGNGFLCKPKDAGNLANVMKKMVQLNDGQRTTMGQHSRMKMVKEFDERIVIKKYLDVINEIEDSKYGKSKKNINLAVKQFIRNVG